MKKALLFILFFIFSYSSALASNLQTPNIDKVYWTFLTKLEKKYSKNKQVDFLNLLNKKLISIKETRSLNVNQNKLIDDLYKLTNERLFEIYYNSKKTSYLLNLNQNNLSSLFKNKANNYDYIFLEDWVWYFYNFKDYLFFPITTSVTQRDLDFNWIDKEKHLIFLKDSSNIWFVKNYEKIKLVTDDIIFWVPDKYDFLVDLKDDKKNISFDSDNLLIDLRNKSLSLTSNKKSYEKIKIIYDYILNNVEYPIELNLSDFTIYSWLDTYNLWKWACEWYTKLFAYMSRFSWLSDVEVIRWFVIDAQDFPDIWHAWIKIWNKYYDPTFDDPVGNKEALSFDMYNYFSLPKDLFYTNRFLYNDLPDELKNSSLEYRKDYIIKSLSNLVSKYNNNNFNLLKIFKLKKEKWINYNTKIDLSNFHKVKEMYIVDNFAFNDWKNNLIIKSLSFFTLGNDNVESILKQVNYDLSDYYFFKWKVSDWIYEYRLAYNVEFY